jgi:hypothetical protein
MQPPTIKSHGHAALGVSEALAALSGLQGGGDVSAVEALGAPDRATGKLSARDRILNISRNRQRYCQLDARLNPLLLRLVDSWAV